jgi:uncharacterized protein YecT (DUF1311 family)
MTLAMRIVSRITVCMLLATPLVGQAEGVADCESRQGSHERRACYAEAYQEADHRLTEAYRKLMNTLSDDYERLLFRHAQIAWKRYCDAQCDLESYPYRGGPDSAPMRERCLAEQMEARRWQIEAYEEGP